MYSGDHEILPPEGDFAPFAGPLIVTECALGTAAYIPHPSGAATLVPIRDGLQLAWTPIEEGRVALAMFVGAESDFGMVAMMSLTGLGEHIADLQSIHAQAMAA